MPEKEADILEFTAGYSEKVPIKGQNKISSITSKVVDGHLIDMFDVIPDAIEQSRFPFSVIVPINERFTCLIGRHQVSCGAPVQCIILEVEDTSPTALALLKVSLLMTGLLLGTISYSEQARYVRILYDIHLKDAGIIVNQNGGDRRSETFNERKGQPICHFLARALDRSVFTIRIYLDHTRYLTLDKMNEVVFNRVPKSSIVGACKLRTEFLARLPENLSEEEKTTEVSSHFLEWVSLHESKQDEKMPKADEQNAKTSENNDQGDEQEKVKMNNEQAGIHNVNQDDKILTDSESENQKTGDGKKQAEITDNQNQDCLALKQNSDKEKNQDNEDNDNTDDDLEDDDEQNDINIGGKPSLPDVTLQSSTKDAVSDIYKQLEDIGNSLIKISQDRPAQELLCERTGDIIRQLIRLFPKAQVTNYSLSTTTLSGGTVWENSHQSAVAQA